MLLKYQPFFLNTWLLKVYVESLLDSSIILVGIVFKLNLYGIFRLILSLLTKVYIYYISRLYLIDIITIIYTSINTLKTIDVKKFIIYLSIFHTTVYLLGILNNTVQNIKSGITLELVYRFVFSNLFICAGNILYNRFFIKLINYYRDIV